MYENCRWSTIATHLPGRTDNEIKNFWNTNLKKKLIQMGFDPMTHRPRADLFATLPHLIAMANLREAVSDYQYLWEQQQAQPADIMSEEALHLAGAQYLHYLLNSANDTFTGSDTRPPLSDLDAIAYLNPAAISPSVDSPLSSNINPTTTNNNKNCNSLSCPSSFYLENVTNSPPGEVSVSHTHIPFDEGLYIPALQEAQFYDETATGEEVSPMGSSVAHNVVGPVEAIAATSSPSVSTDILFHLVDSASYACNQLGAMVPSFLPELLLEESFIL